MIESFALAPMSRTIRLFTLGLLALPAIFLWHPFWVGSFTPAGGIGSLLVGLYAAVWVWWRPTRFELGPGGLRIAFPGRSREVGLGRLAAARALSGAEFHAEFGYAVRIGVGGLFGGFGWLWSRRRGLIDFYISRTDGLVLVELRDGRPILITPERPEALVESLTGRLGR